MSLPVRARTRRAARHFLLPLPLALSACCMLLLHLLPQASAFARFTPGNVLLLDHLNLNHEKGRHDLIKAFYFEVLGLSADPRKAENLDKGRKTLWANAGITQFHLPEADRPQVFDGLITLAYPSEERLQRAVAALQDPPAVLAGTSFEWRQQQEGEEGGAVLVTDPWGTRFRLVVDAGEGGRRGRQEGRLRGCGGSSCALRLTRGGGGLDDRRGGRARPPARCGEPARGHERPVCARAEGRLAARHRSLLPTCAGRSRNHHHRCTRRHRSVRCGVAAADPHLQTRPDCDLRACRHAPRGPGEGRAAGEQQQQRAATHGSFITHIPAPTAASWRHTGSAMTRAVRVYRVCLCHMCLPALLDHI